MLKPLINSLRLCFLLVLSLFFYTAANAEEPRIFGVTDGSVYKLYVKIYWFDNTGVATYSRDGGLQTSYTKGSSLATNGNYEFTLTITENNEEISKTVNFEIDSTADTDISTLQNVLQTKLDIEFDPDTYQGNGPVMTIWAEDMAGNFLQNLYVSNGAATNYMRFSGYAPRSYAVPYWAHKTCPETSEGSGVYLANPEIPLPEGLDGVSGATQKSGFALHSSILPPPSGSSIKVLMEINQSWDTGWYFTSAHVIDSGEEPDEEDGTSFGSVISTNGEPSLIYEVEVPLDTPGTYFGNDPVGYGHFSGRTGNLYTDFYALNGNNEQQYKFDQAQLMVNQFSVTVNKLPGDLTGNMEVDLEDAIVSLKLCAGEDIEINPDSDYGDNTIIGMEETIYILQKISE